jgi:hypothetical protein
MNLKAAVTHGEIEFGLKLSQHGEADIAKGSDEVGEHRDVNRHRFCSLFLNICRVPPRGQNGYLARLLQQRNKLVDRHARLAHDRPQLSLGDFAMVGITNWRNGGADVRRIM